MGRAKFGLYASLQGANLEEAGVTPKQVIDAYRGSHVEVANLWPACGRAGLDVVSGKEKEVYVGKAYFRMRNGALVITLPSGRELWYRDIKIEDLVPAYCAMYNLPEEPVPTLTYHDAKKGRVSTYGGKLVENMTQAGARDILGQAMLRLEEHGFPTILTVHDEWIGEIHDGGKRDNDLKLAAAERIMSEVPDWAEGLPIVVEGFWSRRYRK